MKKNLLFSLLGVFMTFMVVAQNKKITGKVTSSDDGSSLPGVSVQVKGTSKGTQTDVDGNYSLDVPANSTIVFSFVGMTSQEVKVGSQSVINMALSGDSKQLSEVVVTALGLQREKKSLGYAVSNLGADQIAQKAEADIMRSISAKTPGVVIQGGGGAPGQATKINIRGNASMTGSTQPLFVVDGVPFDNSSNGTNFAANTAYSSGAYDIDPNNVESMTVLKGAAAAALYGSRATNGVVLITTKAGSKKARKGLEVSYVSNYANERISTLPDYQNTYTQGSSQNYNGGFIGNWGAPFPAEVDRINQTYYDGLPRYTKTYSTYAAGPNRGKPYPAGTAAHPLAVRPGFAAMYPNLVDEYGNGVPIDLVPMDIIGGFFKDGHLFENSLNVSSTGDKTSLNASVSRMTNEGIVQNQGSNRTSISFGGSAVLANKITVNGSVSYTNTGQKTPPVGAGYYTDLGGFSNEGSIYGRIYYLPRNFKLNDYPFENPVTGDNLFYRSGLDNPLWAAKYNGYTSNRNRVTGVINLSYDIAPWLNLLVRGGANTYTDNRRTVTRKGGSAIPLGRITTEDITNLEQEYTGILTFNKDLSEDINLTFLVGAQANERKKTGRSTTGTDIISTGLNLVNATATQIGNYDYLLMKRILSGFSDARISYKNTYFLNATLRNDNSSTLAPNNRSYWYPSFSASAILSDALKLPSVINFAKFRIGYAEVGNDTDPYNLQTVYNLQTAYRNNAGTVFYKATLGDILKTPELKPEESREFETGLEVQLFKNRISLDLTYYDKNSVNQIVSQRIPSSTGFSNKVVNAGRINNKGFEIGLNIIPVKLSNGFEWSIFTAFTRNRSLVVDAGPQGEIFLGGTGLSSLGTIHRTGYPFGQIYGTRNARDDQGNLLIDEGTGMPFGLPTADIIGDPNPKFLLGVTNQVSWKGFTLSALIDYRHGGQMFSFTAGAMQARGQLAQSENREPLYVMPGVYGSTETYKPILDEKGNTIKNTTPVGAFDYFFSNGFGYYGQDEVNVYDVTTIRLRELNFGYNIPKALLKKTPFGSARIALNARNLWFKAPNMLQGLNLDPEVLSNIPETNIQGFDLGVTPNTRRLGATLNVTF